MKHYIVIDSNGLEQNFYSETFPSARTRAIECAVAISETQFPTTAHVVERDDSPLGESNYEDKLVFTYVDKE